MAAQTSNSVTSSNESVVPSSSIVYSVSGLDANSYRTIIITSMQVLTSGSTTITIETESSCSSTSDDAVVTVCQPVTISSGAAVKLMDAGVSGSTTMCSYYSSDFAGFAGTITGPYSVTYSTTDSSVVSLYNYPVNPETPDDIADTLERLAVEDEVLTPSENGYVYDDGEAEVTLTVVTPDTVEEEVKASPSPSSDEAPSVVTGKTGDLLGPSAAMILNAIKTLAGIDDEIKLIAPEYITPIQTLKTDYLGSRNPNLHMDEILIALSSSAGTNEVAAEAIRQLPKLRGCDAHSTVILSAADTGTYRRLGIQLTCEPRYEEEDRLYHKL